MMLVAVVVVMMVMVLVCSARELELEDRQSRLEAQLRERIASESNSPPIMIIHTYLMRHFHWHLKSQSLAAEVLSSRLKRLKVTSGIGAQLANCS